MQRRPCKDNAQIKPRKRPQGIRRIKCGGGYHVIRLAAKD